MDGTHSRKVQDLQNTRRKCMDGFLACITSIGFIESHQPQRELQYPETESLMFV